MAVISWCTYLVVYRFPMLGINASSAVGSIQIGYCGSDIISMCGIGLVIFQITASFGVGFSSYNMSIKINSLLSLYMRGVVHALSVHMDCAGGRQGHALPVRGRLCWAGTVAETTMLM